MKYASYKRSILLVIATLHVATARISVMYAHEKLGDMVARRCLDEMFPKARQADIQETDEPCILFCVFNKFGVMNSVGDINLEMYRHHVQQAHQLGLGSVQPEYGNSCLENTEVAEHKDVCKKAKTFNECTHLYKIML